MAAAIEAQPTGMDETDWLDSVESVVFHSSLIKTGKNKVFAEPSEMEVFRLITRNPLVIYLPRHCGQ